MRKRDKETEIRERWFPEHKAALTIHGDLKVLDWGKPGTIVYYCRYVFDGCELYISGDIGEAVFRLTWNADVHSFNDIHIHYFYEKLSAYGEERVDFDSEQAVQRLKEWGQELTEEYDSDVLKDLIKVAEGCSSVRNWADAVNSSEFNDFISELDQDYWEWMYGIGDEIPWRIYGYLIGLKMASEQLKNAIHDQEVSNDPNK